MKSKSCSMIEEMAFPAPSPGRKPEASAKTPSLGRKPEAAKTSSPSSRPEAAADFALLPGERMDDIGFGGLCLIQEPSSFCYGIDAVLLADFASHYVKASDWVCDLGTGTGVIPLILSRKTDAECLVGVEIQKDSAERAVRNVMRNQLSHRIEIVCADVAHVGKTNGSEDSDSTSSTRSDLNSELDLKSEIPADFLQQSAFDLVVSNPPYMRRGSGLLNSVDAKTVARHETAAELSNFIRTAAYLLKERGSLCMIHRPNRLVDLFVLCRENGLEPKELQMICPRADREPNLALVRCGKGGRPDLKVLESLWVYDSSGNRTERVQQMYECAES